MNFAISSYDIVENCSFVEKCKPFVKFMTEIVSTEFIVGEATM